MLLTMQLITSLPPFIQLCSGRQLIPFTEDREKGSVHPHLWRERCWEDGGIQKDPAVLRCHLSSQRACSDHQRSPAAVQPSAGGEMPWHMIDQSVDHMTRSKLYWVCCIAELMLLSNELQKWVVMPC